MTERIWSTEQKDIYRWFEWSPTIKAYGKQHLVVKAYAGTGKTSTIVEAVNHAPETKILLCAFNKKIAEELVRRGTRATVKTLHAVGLSCVKTYWPDVKVNFDGDREEALTEAVCGARCPDAIKRLVSRLHTKGREIAPHAQAPGDLTSIMFNFELNPDDEWEDMGFGAAYVEARALEAMEQASRVKPILTGIDGSDMIFLPVRNQWLRKTYDMAIVDETQDMTTAQLEIATGICRGRIAIVGDPNQAIYAFRGADSESMTRLEAELDAEVLPLTITYRCGRRIVELAQRFVPDFTAGPNNPEGVVEETDKVGLFNAAAPGDFILSRLNAPLVSVAMTLLRAGKRTQIAGRDIGAGLQTLVRKLKARSVEDFLEHLRVWEEREVNRLIRAKRDKLIDRVRDRASMLFELSNGAENVQEIQDRIDSLFVDDGLGMKGVITCSSVHKAKGLEADKVFILRDTLRSHTQEERNITYVSITRAKNHLVWVDGIGGK
jgi:DNA helicase-2/ATP-dependent DNA helicase PcrA